MVERAMVAGKPPALAWVGLSAIWLMALGLLGAAGYLVVQVCLDAKGFAEHREIWGIVGGFIAGTGFLSCLAWLATRGNHYTYFGLLFFAILCGPLTCMETGRLLHWAIARTIIVLMGIGAWPYYQWAKPVLTRK